VVRGGEVLRMSSACLREREESGAPDTFRITSPTLEKRKVSIIE